VPDEAKTDELTDLIEWLGELIRQVDSSLLDEWERLTNPVDEMPEVAAPSAPSLTRNVRAFRVLVRNALFRRVQLASLRRYDDLGDLDADAGWTARAWRAALEGTAPDGTATEGAAQEEDDAGLEATQTGYFHLHDEIGTGANARSAAMLIIDEGRDVWTVRQIFDDPAGDHDWGISAVVDLAASDEAGEAVIRVTDVGQL
jgi:hypothetical protein